MTYQPFFGSKRASFFNWSTRRSAQVSFGKIAMLMLGTRLAGHPVFGHARGQEGLGMRSEQIWTVGARVDFPPLTRLDGSDVNWQSYKGKVLIIEFWASWCPFCARQNPILDRFYRAHKSRGVAVVTLSTDKNPEVARQYIRRHGYEFECGMLTPAWDAIYRQRKGLPQLYVFDRDGKLRQIELREMMDEDIEELASFL